MATTKMCLVCGALTKRSYCATHQPKRQRETSSQRGYGKVYKALRTKFLAYWKGTFGSICAGHKRPPHPIDVLTVDHVVPLSKGGTNTWDNLQCLCLSCNSRKKDKL